MNINEMILPEDRKMKRILIENFFFLSNKEISLNVN